MQNCPTCGQPMGAPNPIQQQMNMAQQKYGLQTQDQRPGMLGGSIGIMGGTAADFAVGGRFSPKPAPTAPMPNYQPQQNYYQAQQGMNNAMYQGPQQGWLGGPGRPLFQML